MPSFTIVAECRYADAGVGACIALGSQKWKGNCADFVNTASSSPIMIGTIHGLYTSWPLCATALAME